MSDRFCAEIHIGGTIRRADLRSLAEAIESDGGCLDWGGGAPNAEEIVTMFEEAAKKKEWVSFCDDQATYGEFPQVEAFCVEHAVAFVRTSEAKYEYDGEKAIFLPGKMEKPEVFCATQDAEPAVTLSALERLARKGRSLKGVIAELRQATRGVPPVRLADATNVLKARVTRSER
jgi:hypothetical protein